MNSLRRIHSEGSIMQDQCEPAPRARHRTTIFDRPFQIRIRHPRQSDEPGDLLDLSSDAADSGAPSAAPPQSRLQPPPSASPLHSRSGEDSPRIRDSGPQTPHSPPLNRLGRRREPIERSVPRHNQPHVTHSCWRPFRHKVADRLSLRWRILGSCGVLFVAFSTAFIFFLSDPQFLVRFHPYQVLILRGVPALSMLTRLFYDIVR